MFRELSPKQIESYNLSNHRLNIWVGSVRSGKSFGALLRFIKFIRFGPPGDCIIAGRTNLTLKRNVISPLIDILGLDVRYKAGIGEIKLWNRTIYVIGANDERAEGKIRGSTFAGALVDEVTLMPESFFKMLLSRLSVEDAQLFGTTNPDSPFHWLKQDYVDNKNVDCKVFDFRLTDNPSLSIAYINHITSEYTGLWYQRFIEGKWVLAEGTIFDFFDNAVHIIKFPPGAADYYICGIDYGTTNPTAFSLIGFNERTYPNRWLEKEYYWDSRKEMKQKTDSEYAQDLKKFLSGYKIRAIYLDPSAASFKLELQKAGMTVFDACNEVLDGIRYHSTLLVNGTFKVCHNCSKAIEEYGSYRWDPSAQKRGEDKPLKDNDHLMDSIRYALYSHFYNKDTNRLRPEDIDQMRNEVYGDQGHGKFFDDRMW